VNATALVVVARVKRSLTLTSKSRVIAGLEHVAVPREAGLGRAINGLGEVDCLDERQHRFAISRIERPPSGRSGGVH